MVVFVVHSANEWIWVDFNLILLKQVVDISAWLLLTSFAQHNQHWASIIYVALKCLEFRLREWQFWPSKYNQLRLGDASVDLFFIQSELR